MSVLSMSALSILVSKKTRFLAALALGCASNISWAEQASYNYADIYFVTGELDIEGASTDQDGWGFGGSVALSDSVFIEGSYQDRSGDVVDNVELDTNTLALGLGYIFDISDTTTFDISIDYREDELSLINLSAEGDGFGVSGSIRTMLADNFELYGALGLLEGDYEGALTFNFGAIININRSLALVADYELLDADIEDIDTELSQFRLGARFTF